MCVANKVICIIISFSENSNFKLTLKNLSIADEFYRLTFLAYRYYCFGLWAFLQKFLYTELYFFFVFFIPHKIIVNFYN